MAHKFAQLAFTPTVRQLQVREGSRTTYARFDEGPDANHLLTLKEAEFISARDSFYMASVSETGWPYVQHRGGPVGFMKVLDKHRLGFADYSGNRQYVSVGNLKTDNRVALFFMDYPNRRRLKLLGHVATVGLDELDESLAERLQDPAYPAAIERAFIIHVEGFDWNCPQHITQRFTEAELKGLKAEWLREHQAEVIKTGQAGSSMELLQLPDINQSTDTALDLVITGVRQLTPRVRAYEFRDSEGHELPQVEPGAHLKIPVRLADSSMTTRHYSVASNPERRDIYEIAVLREDGGEGGSKAVHASFNLGTRIQTLPPANHFQLHTDQRSALLIAGGIGITPIKAMAQALEARGIEFEVHYAGRSLAEMPYADRLQRALSERLRLYPADQKQRIPIAALLDSIAKENSDVGTQVYVCGPGRLIDAVLEAAEVRGIKDRIHFERFETASVKDAQPIQVRLARSGLDLSVAPQQSILDAALDAGVVMPFSCKTGQCKTCAVKVLDGEPLHLDSALSEDEKQDEALMCPCISRARNEYLVLDV